MTTGRNNLTAVVPSSPSSKAPLNPAISAPEILQIRRLRPTHFFASRTAFFSIAVASAHQGRCMLLRNP
jgi:hypothetical protein